MVQKRQSEKVAQRPGPCGIRHLKVSEYLLALVDSRQVVARGWGGETETDNQKGNSAARAATTSPHSCLFSECCLPPCFQKIIFMPDTVITNCEFSCFAETQGFIQKPAGPSQDTDLPPHRAQHNAVNPPSLCNRLYLILSHIAPLPLYSDLFPLAFKNPWPSCFREADLKLIFPAHLATRINPCLTVHSRSISVISFTACRALELGFSYKMGSYSLMGRVSAL